MASIRTARVSSRRPRPYDDDVLGFRNYWYPVFSSKEVGKKPTGLKIMGDYLYGKPFGLAQFNNQDIEWVRQSTDHVKRHGAATYPMSKLSQNDAYHALWREFANENARGVGYKYQDGR